MMDEKTKRKMMDIGRSLPKNLIQKGVITEKPYAEMGQKLMDATHSGNKQERDAALKALSDKRVQETIQKTETRIDERVGKDIEKRVEYQMKKALERGEIKPANRNDPFFKFIRSKM